MQFLVRVGAPDVYAYATSGDTSYYLTLDDSFWAYEHDGRLWLAGTHRDIARRDGPLFVDGDMPLYYELPATRAITF
jgi:hypothetical protein